MNETGKIPCSDVNNCPTDYPTCSVAGFCVGSAPAARIDVVSGDAQSAVVGTSLPQPLVVKVSDTNGNPVASFPVAWTVTTNNGQVATGTATTGPNGRASINATAGTVAGANSFAATGSGVSGTSFSATGIPDVATDLVLTGPGSTTAGVAESFTLTAKDKFANIATGYRGTVTFSSTDGSAALPSAYTFAASDAGTHQFTAALKSAGSRSITVDDGSLSISTPGITVDPAAAATLSLTGFSNPATAGTAATVTVTAKDPFNNTATSYRGTVHVTSDDPSALLPGNYTFTAGDNGVHGLSVTLKKASAISTFSITATDTVTATITGSQSSITVHPDVAATLQVAGFNNPATAGTSGFLVVTAFDAFTNIASGYLGTVHFTSSDGAASLPADYTFTVADAGVHTFSVTLKTAAASASITATDTATAIITGTQPSILVNAGATTKLLLTGFPNPAIAGVRASVTVTAKDANNNTTPAYLGTIHFTSSNANPTLPLDYTFRVDDIGSHTFINGIALSKAGPPNSSITVTDTLTPTITGGQTGIVVNPGATLQLFVTGFPSPASADIGGSVTVTAADANGNTTPAYTGTIHFTSDNPNKTLPANYTFLAGDNGIHTFNGVVLKKASPPNYSITATDTVTPSISGRQSGITVNPGATKKLQVAGFPSPVFAGSPGSLTVTAQDANSNTTPAYGGTVHFTTSDAVKTLPADYLFVGTDGGVHTFTGVILNTVSSTASISATDTVTGTITGIQSPIVVTAGPLLFGATATMISGGTNAGLIFIAGGNTKSDGTGTTVSNTWFYNAADSSLTAGPALAFARAFHTATAIGGKVVIAGGASGATGFREFEICTLGATSSCAVTGDTLATSRCNAAAALASGTQVLIAGGDNCTNTTALDTWDMWDSSAPTMPVSNSGGNKLSTGRRLFTATVVGTGKVLLAGGAATPTADLFTLGAPSAVSPTTGGMLVARTGHTATILTASSPTTACPTSSGTNSCVLIAGGNSTAGKTWEIYDPSTDKFPTTASIGHDLSDPQRFLHAAAAFANGKVLLAGGTNGTSALNTSEVFDPSATTLGFGTGPGLQLTRFKAAAAYAPVQDVLILVGGNAVGPSTEQLTTP